MPVWSPLVAKCNGLAVRLPAVVIEALQPAKGDEIEIHLDDFGSLGDARKPGRDELLRLLRAFRDRL